MTIPVVISFDKNFILPRRLLFIHYWLMLMKLLNMTYMF